MADPFQPETANELAAFVAAAAAAGTRLAVEGHASRRGLGRPREVERTLSLRGFSGIIDYDPAELVITAGAGTPLADIEQLLAANRQMLAFEPPRYAVLSDSGEAAGTLGGLVATNLSGPRRLRAGAVRDYVLGVEAVNGRGELFRAGGRVVKNVTGYDLARALTGSFGTLAIFTALTLRVAPSPETEATLVCHGLGDAEAIDRLGACLALPLEISAAAHLPEAAGGPLTAVRLEGFPASVAARGERAMRAFPGFERLDDDRSRGFWRGLGEAAPLKGEGALWRVTLVPRQAAAFAAELATRVAARFFYDWGGGLVWLRVADEGDAAAALIRDSLTRHGGGHALLVVAPDELRRRVAVFEPEAAALALLTRRLKHQFDPAGILEPGRMRAEE